MEERGKPKWRVTGSLDLAKERLISRSAPSATIIG